MWWWVWGFLQLSPDPISPPALSCPRHRHLQPSLLDHQGNGGDTHKWKVQPALPPLEVAHSKPPSALSSRVCIPLSWAILLLPPHSQTAGNMERKETNTPPCFSLFFQTSGQLRLSLSWQSITGSSATTCGQEAGFTQKWEVQFFLSGGIISLGVTQDGEATTPKAEPVEGASGIMISFLERGNTVVRKKEHRSRNNLGSSLAMPRFYSILLQHYIHSQGSAAISWGL